MPKFVPNAKHYKYPLPIHPLDDLPELIPHNPVSWLYWLYSYVSRTNLLPSKIHVRFSNGKHITVADPNEMLYLWRNGFFGTAQLSRSEPTWKQRTLDRLGLQKSLVALEHVTEQRRLERLEFKRERANFEAVRLDLRRQGVAETEIAQQEREFLKSLRDRETQLQQNSDVQSRTADEKLFNDSNELVNLEVLELMPVEAIFLTFALPVLDISPLTLTRTLVGDHPSYADINELCIKYVAYHHYRSHGWCVRSGIKFGCDFLLYKRGPPFQHAEFGIMVLNSDASMDYTWYASSARVVGGAKKSFILCYVELQRPQHEALLMWQQGKFSQLFSSYKVGEIMYRRWIPGKNRD
ncbi:LAME_0G08020g1_1 [Lachancea meyersii CBS 8951]|uniref:tRNA-splicing endonuclease subunit Sen2 n=1 Tax=Lachancea meyersii CBS 8951 TaxID=1266667 RepID=A0A1G4K853_9SACH|nr:LAME_0G08020g1_1 [Lachancea meyersii CBS 8951]